MHLTHAIQRNAQIAPNAIALQYAERNRSWNDVAERVARLAGALRSRGVKPGDRVAMLALNSDRYYEYYYATPWVGAVLVPLNIRWSLQENLYSLEDSGASVLFVDDTFREMGEALMAQSDCIRLAVYTGEGEAPAGMLAYEQLVADAEPIAAHDGDYEAMAGIFYTGGTTGFPKGVMLSHRNIWSSTMSVLVEMELAGHDSTMLHAAPMFHLACACMMWVATLGGARQVVIPAFDPEHVVREIQRREVTDILLVPTMITMLLASDALAGADLSSLRSMTYGASPMPEGTLCAVMEKLPGVGFRQAYGQTELSPVCSVLGPEYHVLEGPLAGKLRSAGRPSYCVTVEIRDGQGRALPAGEIGEIAVKGPNTMLGYWNKPDQTARALVDGWVLTGDVGYLDDDGFLFLVDRVKDMIVTGGENVFSVEVENAISRHPAVHEVAVIGIPSAKWGEAVHAIVRLRRGRTCGEQAIIDFCREAIANYKLPKSVEFRDDPFPVTGAGKVQKNVLREAYWQGRERRIQ